MRFRIKPAASPFLLSNCKMKIVLNFTAARQILGETISFKQISIALAPKVVDDPLPVL